MDIKKRLEYLRTQIENECISQGEICELEKLAEHIDKDDVVLLEWAGVPEFKEEPLVCVEDNCEELQTEDGEYCEKHYINKIKVIDEEIVSSRIVKQFGVELPDGQTLNVEKYQYDDEISSSYENDWNFTDKESQDIFDELSDDKQNDIEDIISEVSMN